MLQFAKAQAPGGALSRSAPPGRPPSDDGSVGVLHEILRQLPTVNFAFLADGVLHIFLLEQKVARISDVAEDLSDRGIAEVLALIGFHTHLGKLLLCGFR